MVDQYAVAVWEVNEWVGTATLKLHMEIMGGALSNHLCVPQTQLMPHEGQCAVCILHVFLRRRPKTDCACASVLTRKPDRRKNSGLLYHGRG